MPSTDRTAYVTTSTSVRIGLLLCMSLASCAKSKKDKSDPAPAVSTFVPGVVHNDEGFFVRVEGDNKDRFSIHKNLTTFDAPCVAKLGEKVNCYVESEEANFYFLKHTLHYNVPTDMCDYVGIKPFWFVNRETKFIKDTLETWEKHGAMATDISGSPALQCANEGGKPLCCFGKYNWVAHVWSDATATTSAGYDVGASPTPQAMDVKLDANACLGGPATLTQGKDYYGIPEEVVSLAKDVGATGVYEIPGTENAAGKQLDILWNVNFAKAENHITATNKSGLPWAMKYAVDPWYETKETVAYLGYPYYAVTCYDYAQEVKSQILIQLRDWNTKAAFTNRAAAPDGYHDTGKEPSPWDTTDRLNDGADWQDLEAGTDSDPTPVSKLPKFDIGAK